MGGGDTVDVVKWGAPAKRRVLQRSCDKRHQHTFHELTGSLHGCSIAVKGESHPD